MTTTNIQVLAQTVWLNHNGLEVGLPVGVIREAYHQLEDTQEEILPMSILHCPSCGVVPSATGNCLYCGEKCNE